MLGERAPGLPNIITLLPWQAATDRRCSRTDYDRTTAGTVYLFDVARPWNHPGTARVSFACPRSYMQGTVDSVASSALGVP